METEIMIDEQNMKKDIYQFIDEIKDLLSPQMWENILLNCSKNEVLVLWLLYRREEVNMSEIAEYIHVPLNTATGVIARMEKNELVLRFRSPEDKRVVTVKLNEKGKAQVQALVEELTYYGVQILTSFSKEEMDIFYRMMNKVMDVLKKEHKKDVLQKKVRRITIE